MKKVEEYKTKYKDIQCSWIEIISIKSTILPK